MAKRKKRRNKAGKGSKFEREVCTQLSLWWTRGERDDIFWRSSTSGARATSRRKKGKKTAGQDGDVAAIDPDGVPFVRMVTLELKNGYNRCSPFDLVDKLKGAAEQQWEEWIRKTRASRRNAGSFSWMIISHRDRRETMCTAPLKFFRTVYRDNNIRQAQMVTFQFGKQQIASIPFREFLQNVRPARIRKLHRSIQLDKKE